jgi:signal transduction histidine kinase
MFFFSDFLYANVSKQDSTRTEKILTDALNNVYSDPIDSKQKIENNLSLILKDNYLLSKSYNHIGIAYDVLGDNDSAIYYYNIALEIAIKSGLTGMEASTKNNLGLIYWNIGSYDKAIGYYESSLELFKKLNKTVGIASALNNLGLIYQKIDQNEKSLSYYRKSYSAYRKTTNQRGESAALANIGIIHAILEKYDSSFFYYQKAIEIKKQINDDYGLGICYSNLGKNYQLLNNYDSSFKYNRKAEKIYRKYNSKHHLSEMLYSLGIDYEKKKKFKQSEQYYLEAEKIAIEIGNKFCLNNTYKRLVQFYANQSKWEQAYLFSVKYKIYQDSLYSENKVKIIFEVQEKYESEQKNRKIAEQEVNLAQSKLKDQQKNYFLLLAILGIVSLLVIVFYIFNTAKNKRIQLIKDKELKIKEEKLRISRDLHDHIGAELTLIKSRIDKRAYLTKNMEEKKELEEISDYSKIAIDQLRKTIWATKSDKISLENFSNNLSKYIARFQYKFSLKEQHNDYKLSSTKALNLFRVCQETINNSIKYAEGNFLSVEIIEETLLIEIIIKDNGKGFDTHKTNLGFGLTNMEERMKEIGANFTISSNKEGTTTVLTLAKVPT